LNHHYYSSKFHGFTWGWYEHRTGKPLGWHRDNWQPCWDTANTTGVEPLFQFGNVWACKQGDTHYGKPFQHPALIPHDNWVFIDNPEVPQLLWPNPANPQGRKTWTRCVRGDLFTHTEGSGTHRVNSLLREHSAGKLTDWCDLIRIQAPIHSVDCRTVLICPVSAPNYVHYYGTTQTAWLQSVTGALKTLGYTWEIRQKPGRKQRVGNQLTDQLATRKYCATISQHSASATESICAGVPAVVTGPHPIGACATPWREFAQGELRMPHPDTVRTQIDHILNNTYHKSELEKEIPL